MHSINQLTTEQPHPAARHLDEKSALEIVTLMNAEDSLVPTAVAKVLPEIAAAVDEITHRLQQGGRLFYVGAGTSGRLGVLDASECPPTFGTDKSMVQALIAGGPQAILEAVEGAEDSEELGMSDLDLHGVGPLDAVVGITASGRSPYVVGALKAAKRRGAAAIGLCNNGSSAIAEESDICIAVEVGPEVVMGSTRLKSGTAQKLVLNMLSTATMIRLGRVYDNLMVDVQPLNVKLVDRAKRIIALASPQATPEQVEEAFERSGRKVKTAIVMLLADVDVNHAVTFLQSANGFVSRAVELAMKS
jgi:N-acetylmuramic acid 6-phosphate etherase